MCLKSNSNDKLFKGFIYKITNKVNGKIYVGKTHTTIEKRWKSHVWTSKRATTNSILHHAIRKYGEECFELTLLDEAVAKESLNEKECFWIAQLNARDTSIGYNIARGGDGGVGGPMFKGHKHAKETRRQMSNSRRGINNSNFGNHRIMPEDEKAKHGVPGERNGMFGKHHTNAAKNKSREKHLNRKAYSNLKTDEVRMLPEDEGMELIKQNPDWFQGNIHARMYKNKH